MFNTQTVYIRNDTCDLIKQATRVRSIWIDSWQ